MKNLKTQGFILLDVDVVALNNAGKDKSTDLDNAVATKQIRKNGKTYTYVSGQSWRYWWRSTLQKDFDWEMSPIIRGTKNVFTAADPINYPDDDVFGYMKAPKKENKKDKEEDNDEEKEETSSKDTVTRVSPLKNSAIVSVTSVRPVSNWSSMSRQEGDAVPYTKQEYSAIMKGMFSLDLQHIGTFAAYNRTGFKNLSEKMRKEAIATEGSTQIVDTHMKTAAGESHKLVRLKKETRIKRVADTIAALKIINGGAMQTNNMTDVTPKFIVLATMASGNHPFSHLAGNKGINSDEFVLHTEGLSQVLEDYEEQFEGTIFIGVREGFLDVHDHTALKAVADKFADRVILTSVNKAIDQYIVQVKTQMP